MKTAVIPGSFDPITCGHVNLISRAAALFDQVLVVAMINCEKQYCFTADERVAFMRDALKQLPNVTVEYSDEMLYEYVTRKKADVIVKGIRNASDAAYEMEMAVYNRAHAPGVETLFLPAQQGMEQISSTEVKRRAQAGSNLCDMVTPMVAAALSD